MRATPATLDHDAIAMRGSMLGTRWQDRGLARTLQGPFLLARQRSAAAAGCSMAHARTDVPF